MRHKCKLDCALILLVCLAYTAEGATKGDGSRGELSYSEALESYRTSVAVPARITYTASTEVRQTILVLGNSTSKPVPLVDESSVIVYRGDEERLDVSRDAHYVTRPNPQSATVWKDHTLYRGVSLEGKTLLQNSKRPDKSPTTRHQVSLKLKPADTDRVRWHLSYGRALDGYLYFNDSKHLADVMQDGTNKRVAVEADGSGHTFYILQADTPYGVHKVRLDPAQDFMASRVEVTRSSADHVNGELVSGRQWQSCDELFELVARQQIGDRWVPCESKSTLTTKDLSGEVRQTVATHRRSNLDLEPVFGPDSFRLDVPDGTRVAAEGNTSGLSYEWRGGNVVPAAQPDVTRAIDGAIQHADPFPRRPRTSLIWLGVFVSLLCMTGAYVWWWRRRAITR